MRVSTVLFCMFLTLFPATSFGQGAGSCHDLSARLATTATTEQPPDLPLALATCEEALAAHPEDAQVAADYARVLERAGRLADALKMYRWAVGAGDDASTQDVARLETILQRPAEWDEAAREQFGAGMAGVSAGARQWRDSLPPDSTDPLTLVGSLGTEPAALAAWIGENIRLVPYSGALRGPRGVLNDHRGNPLDRALALAALLAAAGEDVRLAHGMLTEQQAQVLAAAHATSPVAPPAAKRTRDELMTMFSTAADRLPSGMLEAAVDQAIQRRDAIESLLSTEPERLTPLLEGAVAGASKDAAERQRRAALDNLTDYYWVQVGVGASWKDVDPDAALLGTLTASETLDPAKLPDSLKHAVTVRVILEIQSTGGAREETVANWSGFPADTGETLITLSHTTDAASAVSQLVSAEARPEEVLAALDAATAWTPLLTVNGQVQFDKLFTRDGAVRTADSNVLAQMGRGMGANLSEVTSLLSTDPSTPQIKGVPTAEWIETEIVVPGSPPKVERRTVFDLLGPSARKAGVILTELSADQVRDRALQLSGVSDILVMGAAPAADSIQRRASQGIAGIADAFAPLALVSDPTLDSIPDPPRLALSLRQLAALRFNLPQSASIFEPNVLMLHQRLVRTAKGAEAHDEVDVVFNGVSDVGDPYHARLVQGAIDTVAEAAVAADQAGPATLIAADEIKGAGWTLLSLGDESRLGTFDADLRTRLEADLGNGKLILAPQSGNGATGWWRIDAETGAVLGMRYTGGGAAMSESALLFIQGATMGMCLAAVGGAVNLTVAGRLIGAGICMAAAASGGGVGLAGYALGGAGFGGAIAILTTQALEYAAGQ